MTLTDLLPRRKEVEAPPPPPPPVSHKGVLEVGGMVPLYWDTANPVSVDRVRSTFQQAIMSGYVGQSYKQTKMAWGGTSMYGEITREFDPEADEIRMSLPYAGG